MERKLPQPGQRYRHFKDRLYQIITLATHSETGEQMVVYQALYDDFEIYVRPLSLFMGEIDRETYPNVTQKYRFEEVSTCSILTKTESRCKTGDVVKTGQAESESTQNVTQESSQDISQHSMQESSTESLPEGVSPKLMEFLDADTDEARYKILSEMADIVDDHMIDTMAVVLDMVIEDGPIDWRFQELKNCIRTRMRYEINRFR